MKPSDMTDEEFHASIDTYNEEYRARKEAEHVAGFPSAEQREWYLDGVKAKRGQKAAQELRVRVGEILRSRESERMANRKEGNR